ncbi:UDP-N-acetylmuramoyl-L-alanine--D-glutamate ligase [Empedobacter stercoris]|uniref:UDP-N-acetylmuramoylalanine--D-glutamate ligase n=1 Tax=Empedobacter falsenii TaxID=343874 RepID=A0ABY8V971_9FLAO|nr:MULTISPECIES: UDP-N-acetylmuramoyl-L-alanine--D-glutamate ligase [Empedobacter]MCA4776322.1 UDP-N-acetylmuramoyl-L-alanine--D-glutamate ligase [Empedobacter stercoris]MDM1522661.1 UDP-N-acetylmuramoyl-L-alanine--D-glutamate ligase [Empedobacter sp. 225-1]MDM1543749.1 UDP-N-acetylmuramoyl-L-alanine--D-glutamate ligase [Empedobacter sp. 189-2]UWX66639.1 UDP-N-acetylmuramoyl-L-alanine--D-glutamate ligase [Empedobacter stercoris]WIH96819.1 UDP-N-acetylmuramoyl-L-alanine--D-glutamate ligase [Emp
MKRLVVLGGGESGVGTAILAKKENFEVFLSDMGQIKDKYKQLLEEHGIAYEEGQHTEDLILNADEIMKSPGIPKKAALIQKLEAKGVSIISEIEFASRYTDAKIIAITGSNGKTTTTSLMFHILKQAGLNVGLGGNIGKSFAKSVAEDNFDYYVLEVSSFQLDDIKTDFKPYVAILLNITPDHLDQYNYQFDLYAKAKFRITENQDENDYFIYNLDDPKTMEMIDQMNIRAHRKPFTMMDATNEAYANNELFRVSDSNGDFTMLVNDLGLIGKHNVSNSLAAAVAAKIIEINNEDLKKSLSDFKSVEHRLEPVLTIGGIDFVNDSKATNVNATYYALESMTKPIVWIVGGTDKGNDYSEVLPFVKKKVKAIVCLGVDNAKIIDFFSPYIDTIVETNNMKDCVAQSYQLATKGETVLLSPACASFDLFNGYEDRGDQFKENVRKL